MAPFIPDPDQLRVLEHAHGPLAVAGGFGTGKTAVLRERFARLIAGGEDPERVALVVGSRRARDEARRALLDRLGVALPRLTVVTMHGLAFHVLGGRSARGGDPPPEYLSAADQFSRVRELLHGEDEADWPAYGPLLRLRGFADEIRQFVIRAQEALVTPERIEDAAAERGLSGWRELAAFLRRYLDVLDANGEVDAAGLLVLAARAAAEGEPPFDHVLVDDHQDSTLAAEELLRAVRARATVVAGNADGHLFSFQGMTDAPFRRAIAAGPVIELTTLHRPPPGTVEAWRAAHVSEEHAAVARELRRIHVDDGVAWRDLAVVVRRFGPHATGMLRALDDAGIPRSTSTTGPPAALPASRPFVLAFRWIVADRERRRELMEPILTSSLGELSPGAARTFLRLVHAFGHDRADALEQHAIAEPEDALAIAGLREVLVRAEGKRASVLDAFGVLWRELPFARRLVEAAEHDEQADADLDDVMAFSRLVSEAGTGEDPSVDAFLGAVDAAEGAPEPAEGDTAIDAVQVLAAHAAVGRSFDTVVAIGALEGDFPSLARPEPMFDLAALEGIRSRAEVNRERLADERRLFAMVGRRARRRLLLTATEPRGAVDAVTLTSRFADELGLSWAAVPVAGDAEPISVREAVAVWRRTLASPDLAPADRLAALDGLLALGEDPRRWWFRHAWSDDGLGPDRELRLSYSRLDTFENCALQFVLSTELGLDRGGGHSAWVGRLIHRIIEDCERGLIERSPAAFVRVLEERWNEARFPSYAISEAELHHAKTVLIPNWFSRYAQPPATAVEQVFEFELDGARIRGKIDRIGEVPEGGTRITDYKTGRSEGSGPPADSLQLGIYYLAVNGCDELAEHRPVSAVELAFLGGKGGSKRDLDVKEWVIEEGTEDGYQERMRERMRELIAEIRALRAGGEYHANTKAQCMFCDFQTLCTRYPQGGAVFPIEAVRAGAPAEATS